MNDGERDELAEIIGNTFHNEFLSPSDHTADAILTAGYRKIDALIALIQEAESTPGSSSYCNLTTYQIREALGMDVSTWIEDVNRPLNGGMGMIPAEAVEIGYVCRHGHFQFNDDPDGDACGTKNVGRIYIEAEPEITPEELAEAIGYALESHHRKMEEWRAH